MRGPQLLIPIGWGKQEGQVCEKKQAERDD